jgi:PAS domain S-box-containing protein
MIQTENTFDRLIATTVLPLVVADEMGMIRMVNREFEQNWAWPSDELVGKGLGAIVPEGYRDAHHAGFSRFLVSGRGTLLDQPLVLPVMRGDGLAMPAEVCLHADNLTGRWRFAATAKPLPPNEEVSG